MKKLVLLIVILLVCSFLPTFASDVEAMRDLFQEIPFGVLCNSNKTMCTVGNYTLRASGTEIFTYGGVMCSSSRTMCTNGVSVMRSSSPLF